MEILPRLKLEAVCLHPLYVVGPGPVWLLSYTNLLDVVLKQYNGGPCVYQCTVANTKTELHKFLQCMSVRQRMHANVFYTR